MDLHFYPSQHVLSFLGFCVGFIFNYNQRWFPSARSKSYASLQFYAVGYLLDQWFVCSHNTSVLHMFKNIRSCNKDSVWSCFQKWILRCILQASALDKYSNVIFQGNLLDRLPNWLDRLFEGTTHRYYINYWPDFGPK